MVLPVRCSNRGGFTLVEFLVAIVILMVGLLALLQTVNMAIDANGSNKKREGAVLLADQAMGRLRGTQYASVVTNSLSGEYPNLQKKSYAGLGFVNYSVYNVVTALASNTKNVQVVVSWKEKGVRKSHALTTVMADQP